MRYKFYVINFMQYNIPYYVKHATYIFLRYLPLLIQTFRRFYMNIGLSLANTLLLYISTIERDLETYFEVCLKFT